MLCTNHYAKGYIDDCRARIASPSRPTKRWSARPGGTRNQRFGAHLGARSIRAVVQREHGRCTVTDVPRPGALSTDTVPWS